MKRTTSKQVALLATIALLSLSAPLHAAAPATPTRVDAKPGEVASVGDLAVAVLGWDEIKPSQFSKPEAGQKFVGVETVIVNLGKKPVSISSLGQGSLRDEESQKYDPNLMAGTAGNLPQLSGVILPGERLRGNLNFEVPESIKTMEFRFVPEMFGSDDELAVMLDAKPGKVEAPKMIKGESMPKTAKVGEAVKSGDFTITLNSASVGKTGMLKPAKGNRYVVVDVTITNDSKKKQPLSTALQMNLKDDQGYHYGVSIGATASSKAKTPDGELSAGDKIKGQIGFEVPTTAKGLAFEFQGEAFEANKVLIALPEIK
jgi:hypothetical protein